MEYLTINGVDERKCSACGACVLECPTRLFERRAGRVAFDDPFVACIRCSHCLAVCPSEAIRFTADQPPFNLGEGDSPEAHDFYPLLRRILISRRSVRRFKQVPVEEEKIAALLDVLRYAPSGTNLQQWEYILVTDPAKKDYLLQATLAGIKWFAKLLAFKWLILPFIKGSEKKFFMNPRMKDQIRETLEHHQQGGDRILYHAPLVLVLHSPSYGHIAGNDAGIALTYAMLSAHALGLGSCWLGFVQEAFFRSGKMRRAMDIPQGHSVWGVLALGYPVANYYRAPVRKPLKVRHF